MDARNAYEYHGARIAPVAQLDRVLPSEGRGRGFESRLVHQIEGKASRQTWMFSLTEKPHRFALAGLFSFYHRCSPHNATSAAFNHW
jgi:hypothetical protein